MNIKTMRHVFLLAALAGLLSGCFSVYKVEVQQGNVVTQEMIDKLKPGLTRNQVRYVLGTPLVTDPFHRDRWDYYYYLRHSNEATGATRHLTVIFKNDALVSVQGDTRVQNSELPADEPAAKSADTKPAAPATDIVTKPATARAL